MNAAGGNNPDATTGSDKSFFDLPESALRFVSDLNLLGTMIPSQVFGKLMAQQKAGVILNISSMNAFRPLTRIPAYSAAKAAVSNFTQWLAVHMAQEYSDKIRVNAIAPGFFLTEQNRFLLTDKDTGKLTARGRADSRTYADEPVRGAGGPAWRSAVAAFPDVPICHRHRSSYRRRLLGLFRSLSAMILFSRGSSEMAFSPDEVREALFASLDRLGERKRVLAVPPDFTRYHSQAGMLTEWAWEYFGNRLVDILPAIGTHYPMTDEEIKTMFGKTPRSVFRIHDWRQGFATLGEVPAAFVQEVSEGAINYRFLFRSTG